METLLAKLVRQAVPVVAVAAVKAAAVVLAVRVQPRPFKVTMAAMVQIKVEAQPLIGQQVAAVEQVQQVLTR